jgi:hypothetical protein
MVAEDAIAEPAPTVEPLGIENPPVRWFEPVSEGNNAAATSRALPLQTAADLGPEQPLVVDDVLVATPVEFPSAPLAVARHAAPETPPAGDPLPIVAMPPRHAAAEASEREASVVQPIEAGFEAEDRDLLLQAAARRPLTSRWVADTLAISANEARELLRSMVADGALRRIGQARGTQYVLPDWAESRNIKPRQFVFGSHQRQLVLRAARGQRLTNEKIRNLLDISPGQALELLSELVQEGLLEKRGQARGTHYVLTSHPAAAGPIANHRPGGRIHLPRVDKRPRQGGH